MINTCKEFLLLPLRKGYLSVRDFGPCVRDAPPNGGAFMFTYICI